MGGTLFIIYYWKAVMNTSHIILAIAWIIYCILHSVLASTEVKLRIRNMMGDKFRYYRFGYTLFSFAGLLAILIFQVSIPSPLVFIGGQTVLITGSVLAAIGAAMVLLNIIKYFVQLSGVRWLVSSTVESRLERDGLHRYVRHPLYFSTFLFIWSLWLVYPFLSLLMANVVITVYTLVALRFEEKKLLIEFGEEYRKYQEQVPMIIPRIMKWG
ncbi:MAG TPA: isoprenylcysteine carboxylmethyltransferase family protein [Chitinophagaceae bacterium]